jgi:hypothetical protein
MRPWESVSAAGGLAPRSAGRAGWWTDQRLCKALEAKVGASKTGSQGKRYYRAGDGRNRRQPSPPTFSRRPNDASF